HSPGRRNTRHHGSAERIRARPDDLDLHRVPEKVGPAVEMDDLEVPRAAREAAVVADTLDEHLLAALRARCRACCASFRTRNRRSFSGSGTSSIMRRAAVPGRGEYRKTNRPSKATSSTDRKSTRLN